MKTTILSIVVVLALGSGVYWIVSGNRSAEESKSNENTGSMARPQTTTPDSMENTNPENPTVILKTNKGDVALELFVDKMPITAGNFLKLAREGFYNNTKFHRVIAGFMVQGGDPNSKGGDVMTYGTGGPGYTIEDEFVEGLSNVRGTIAMANTGAPNSGGSQFFINVVDNTPLDFDKPPLSSKHPVFGKVIAGMDVVDTIVNIPTGMRDVPIESVVISSIEIVQNAP